MEWCVGKYVQGTTTVLHIYFKWLFFMFYVAFFNVVHNLFEQTEVEVPNYFGVWNL